MSTLVAVAAEAARQALKFFQNPASAARLAKGAREVMKAAEQAARAASKVAK